MFGFVEVIWIVSLCFMFVSLAYMEIAFVILHILVVDVMCNITYPHSV
jgi:hypothetical protein